MKFGRKILFILEKDKKNGWDLVAKFYLFLFKKENRTKTIKKVPKSPMRTKFVFAYPLRNAKATPMESPTIKGPFFLFLELCKENK